MQKPRYILLIYLFILGDVFFFPVSSDFRIFGLLGIYIFLIRRYHWKSVNTFVLTLMIFLLTYILYVFTDPAAFHQPLVPAAERLAVWAYLFLIVGVVQKWRE